MQLLSSQTINFGHISYSFGILNGIHKVEVT